MALLNWFGRDTSAPSDRIHAIGRELLERARAHESSFLSGKFWNDKLMAWSMKDPAFKTQLFRFVDVFPNLRNKDAVHRHLTDYLSQPGVKLPPGLGLGMAAGGLAQGTFVKTVTGRIEQMASTFIAGTDAADALPKLRKLWDRKLAFSVDLLGEACISDAEADVYQQRYLDLIEGLPSAVGDWPDQPLLERDHLGTIPRVNVSVKASSLVAKLDPIDFDGCIDRCMERLVPVLESASRRGVFVNFDMESHATKDLTIALFQRCCEAVDFEAGIALQAYLRSGDDDAAKLIDWTKRIGRQITVRLVKGAYWDYETIHAQQMGWPIPVWSEKPDTDACFERMSVALLDATPRGSEGGIRLALGSHNVRSIAAALAKLETVDLPSEAIELQMLHGMADSLKAAAVERGLRVREYVPVGELIPGMAYLVRRLLENTSNESWLLASNAKGADIDALLAAPEASRSGKTPEQVGFTNEPPRDFADERQREAFAQAANRTDSPSPPTNVREVDEIVGTAARSSADWRECPVAERAKCLHEAAATMRQRRDQLAAAIIAENHKGWHDADAEVCEAIDFCEFYAAEATALFKRERLPSFTGEINELTHEPRGFVAVISPWNFPLAITCGMTVAALVTGNTVIVKPAEQTPCIAAVMCELLWEAGVPRDVLHLAPGAGETVGAALARHPRVDMVAFTGSAEVGRDILRAAVEHPPAGALARHVVCETGGKNALIVDASADLDEAVVGVRDSAFGFQGQKCSACSRAIVVGDAYEPFLERLIESTRSLIVGDPRDPGTDVGPMIDTDAAAKARRYINLGRDHCALAIDTDGDNVVGPHIFTDLPADHPILTDEIFGPVLAVIRVDDFDHALRLALDVPYRLTGGVFSRTPEHLTVAAERFAVGNLYLNRGITGALVARQPFGGFGSSGLGTKAGGRDYLKQFVVPRVTTENAMRRGFAPD
ncbi:MAG: proline dehydrogenase family protein [Planctomycetota bacterium]